MVHGEGGGVVDGPPWIFVTIDRPQFARYGIEIEHMRLVRGISLAGVTVGKIACCCLKSRSSNILMTS